MPYATCKNVISVQEKNKTQNGKQGRAGVGVRAGRDATVLAFVIFNRLEHRASDSKTVTLNHFATLLGGRPWV